MTARRGHRDWGVQGRFVARRTRNLSVDQASLVDERAAESDGGRFSWSRFDDPVTELVAAGDPDATAERER